MNALLQFRSDYPMFGLALVLSKQVTKGLDRKDLHAQTNVTPAFQDSFTQIELPFPSRTTLTPAFLPLEFILDPEKPTGEWERLIAAFIHIEAQARKDGDIGFAEDVRQTQVALLQWDRGEFPDFKTALDVVFCQFFGKHPAKMLKACIAMRKAQLGREYYDFYDSQDRWRPEIPTLRKPPVANDGVNERLAALLATGSGGESVAYVTPSGAAAKGIHAAPSPPSESKKENQ